MSTEWKHFVDKKTRHATCIRCNILIRKASGRIREIKTEVDAVTYSRILKRVVSIGDLMCNKCRLHLYKEVTTPASNPEDSQEFLQPEQSSAVGTLSVADMSSSVGTFSSVEPSSSSAAVSAEISSPGTSSIVVPSPESSSPDKSDKSSSESAGPSCSSTEDPSFVMALNNPERVLQYIEMPFSRVVSTHRYCFVCGSTKHILSVPAETRKQVFLMRRLYVPKGNRCCPSHLIKKRLFHQDVLNLNIFSNSSLVDSTELRNYFEYLSVSSDSSIKDKVGDFTLSEERLKVFTGLTWENIIQLREMMGSLRNSEQRDVIQAIVVFLFKLRTGNSNSLIAAILGLEREQQVSDFCKSVINSFEKDVLPFHFGLAAVSREHLVQHETSLITKKLFNISTQLALIFDGTYIRHEKSSNNEYQRKSYSGQKKLPLCKPFTVCTTNGYIVDMLGPFYANQNDAEIMRIAMQDPNGLQAFLKPGDICIVDRGFRDVKSYLEERGFSVLMPALKGKRSQLTTAESNASRHVTKVRWVVEAIHGIVGQKYRLLHQQMDNKLLPKVRSLCRIACFLNNTFGKRLNSDVGLCEEIVDRMSSEKSTENSLSVQVENQRWNRRKVLFKRLSATELLDFPEMTEKDLKILFTGSYQLSQAVSYLAELMDEDNNINILSHKESNNILKFQVRSRHINSKTYRCYIDYTPNSIGYSGIKRYCCECANGNRTVGCCSHVAAIIYYLSHARYLSKIVRPAEILSRLFNAEQVTPVINADSDED